MIWILQPDLNSWISGIYKIQRYERSITDGLGVHYRAYVKRRNATCWGWHPYPETPWYLNLTAAQAACAQHLLEAWKDAGRIQLK
jgi:hypothetical protein